MKISIITVCLNSEETIRQTIKSVIGQKDGELEYIIIDGGSTDRTAEIINEYRDDIDVIVSGPDQGIYDAMNKGISLAKGAIIGIINSDDWYEPGIIKKVQKQFVGTKADIVYGRMNLIDGNGAVKPWIPSDLKKLRFEMVIPHPTVFVKKNIYEKYGLFSLEYRIAADYELMLRFYIRGARFVFMDEILANFRTGGISSRQLKSCACETFYISKRYVPFYPPDERAEVEKQIDINRKAFCFRQLLDEFPDRLLVYITGRGGIPNSKRGISVFGAGRWGMDMYRLMSEAGMRLSFLIDNKKEFWGEKKEGMKISPPDVLRSFKGVLLILVKGCCVQILSQVEQMDNRELMCITWEELVNDLEDHVFFG